MNAHADQDIVTIPRADALQVYTTPGAIKPYLDKVRAEIDTFNARGLTVDTVVGRKEIKSFSYRIARTRAALEAVGKALADEVKAIPKKVDATRRDIKNTLESWEDGVRAPLTTWENAEKARIDAHEAAIAALVENDLYGARETSADVEARLGWLRQPDSRDWQEFAERAGQVRANEIKRMEAVLATVRQREADAAELARLRAAEEERIARERKEQARREAEERERKIAEQAAAAERERAEQARQQIEREKQDAEERAARAQALADARAREAEEKAAKAVEEERRRRAEEKARQEREAAEREADKKHRARINNEVKAALVSAGLSEPAAVTAITAIARGEVPHVKISY